MTTRSSRGRLGVTSAVAIVALAAYAAIGGTGLAGGLAKPGNAQYAPGYQNGQKITICHKGKTTLRVALASWPAHKAHGDELGPCAAGASAKKPKKGTETTTATTESSTKSKGKSSGKGKGKK